MKGPQGQGASHEAAPEMTCVAEAAAPAIPLGPETLGGWKRECGVRGTLPPAFASVPLSVETGVWGQGHPSACLRIRSPER